MWASNGMAQVVQWLGPQNLGEASIATGLVHLELGASLKCSCRLVAFFSGAACERFFPSFVVESALGQL